VSHSSSSLLSVFPSVTLSTRLSLLGKRYRKRKKREKKKKERDQVNGSNYGGTSLLMLEGIKPNGLTFKLFYGKIY
jgi:hypothetical protein